HSLPLGVSPAKSQIASRSFLLAAQRKVTARCLPEARVEGVTPASEERDSGSGNRARQSPISASSAAARMVPGPGEGSEDVAVGVGVQQFSDPSVESLDLGVEGVEERHERQGDAAAGIPFGT